MSAKEKLLASAQKNLQKGQIAKAIKDYQEIVKADPKDIRTRQKLAELLSRNRMADEALGEYGAVAKYYAGDGFYLKAIAVYKQMQKLDPTRPEIYHRLAELNEKQGLIGNAIAEYRNLLAHYEQKRMHSEIIQVLQKIKDLEPENLSLRVKLAETFIHCRQKEKAREEFREIVQSLGAKGDQARLLKLYEFFLPHFPDDPELRIGHAEALIHRGDTDRGIHALKDLLKKNLENSDILRRLAQGYRLARDFQNERLTYQHLLKNHPDDLDLRQAHLRASLDQREFTRALAELEEWKEAFCEARRTEVLRGFYEELKSALPKEPRILLALKSLSGEKEIEKKVAVKVEAAAPAPSLPVDSEVSVDELLGDSLLEETVEDLEEVADLEEIAEVIDELPPAAPEPAAARASLAEPEPEEIPLSFLEVVDEDLPETAEAVADPELELELELELDLDLDESVTSIVPGAEADDLLMPEEEEILSLEEIELEAEPAPEFEPEPETILELEIDAEEEPEAGAVFPAERRGFDLALDPELPAGSNLQSELEEAEFYLRQALFTEAEGICRDLLKQHPGHPEVTAKLALIVEQRSREVVPPKEEFYDLGAAVLDDEEPLAAENILNAGDAQDLPPMEPSRPKRGVKTEVEVEDPESHYHLGIAYKEMGLLDDAVHEFDQAMRAPSRAVDCLLLKGLCLVEKGAFETAEEALKAGLARPEAGESEKVSLHFEMGALYEAWDRPPDALENFQFVADHDPFFREVGERISALRLRLGLGEAGNGGTGAAGKGKNRVSYV